MNIFYKIYLYINIIKSFFKHEYKKEPDSKYFSFLKNYFNKKKNGIYIDVGAYHPIRLSNTKFLYDKGWRGINIDISKKSIDLFNIVRKNDINLNIGIGKKKKKTTSYFKKNLFHSNTLDFDHAQIFLKKFSKKRINIFTLDFLISKYLNGKKIDFIDIDCEGKDLEVLQGLNLSRHEIDLISIEMHGYNSKTKNMSKIIFDLMKKNRFKKIYGNYPDTLIFKKYK